MVRRTVLILGLVASLAAGGWSFQRIVAASFVSPPADSPPTPQKSPDKWPDEPNDREPWQLEYDMPAEIAPADVAFESPAMAAKFQRADLAARRVAGEDWGRRPGIAYPYRNYSKGERYYTQSYGGFWSKAAGPHRTLPSLPSNHTIAINTTLFDRPRCARQFDLWATLKTEESWDVTVVYKAFGNGGRVDESFDAYFTHADGTRLPEPRYLLPGDLANNARRSLQVGPGRAAAQADLAEGGHRYSFAVGVRPFDGPRSLPGDEAVAAVYWRSPESFRDALLADYELLEKKARERISLPDAIRVTSYVDPIHRRTGRDGAIEKVVDVEPSEKIKETLLAETLADIADKRKVIEADYKELHAAMTAAFPELPEVFAAK